MCGVRFAIPPKEDPYFEKKTGNFWDFPRGVVSPNLLNKLITGRELYQQAAAMHANEYGSGYISSAVTVSCLQNAQSIDNQKMLDLLKKGIMNYNGKDNTEGMEATRYEIQSSKELKKWNRDVIDIVVAEYFSNPGGVSRTRQAEYTMFTTPQYIFEVRVYGENTDVFVKETAKRIFDNLIFE